MPRMTSFNFLKPKQILVLLALIIGLSASTYLVTHPKIFKSKAGSNISQAFEIKDDQGRQVSCTDNVCNISSLKVNIKVVDLVPLEKEQ